MCWWDAMLDNNERFKSVSKLVNHLSYTHALLNLLSSLQKMIECSISLTFYLFSSHFYFFSSTCLINLITIYMYKHSFDPYGPRVFLWDLGKQWRPRSDTAICGIWSGSPLFVYRLFYRNLNKNGKIPPNNPKIGNKLIQLIKIGKSIWHKRVKILYFSN